VNANANTTISRPTGRRGVIGTALKRVLPWNFKPPEDLPRRVLSALGYYRLRTWAGARGEYVPQAHLYQPKFSPWLGDPEFDAYYRRIKAHTMVLRDSCHILLETLQQALRLEGNVVECGVFRGGTALLEAMLIAERRTGCALLLFDSFRGMPETTEGFDSFGRGDFGTTSAEVVRALLAPYPFVQMHVGFIPETFPGSGLERIALSYVDVNIYKSVKDCIEYIYPRLVPGGFLIFDDYGYPSCPGARRAVDEAFAALPEVPICLPTGQCLVVKLGPAGGCDRGGRPASAP
jgi:O-methyltransferase